MALVLSAVDVYYFVKELTKLVPCKVEQIYQHDDHSLTVRFYKSQEGKLDLFLSPPNCLYLTSQKPASSEELFGFCGILRKYLPSAALTDISQIGFSRTIELTFAYHEKKFYLIIELYDKGNIILCDENHQILSPLTTQRWQHRTIAAGQQYVADTSSLPHDRPWSEIKSLAKSAAEESLSTSKFAATKLSLGGVYAKVLCNLLDVNPNIIISENEAKILHEGCSKLFSQELSPVIIQKADGSPIVYPCSVFAQESENAKSVVSLSLAYEESFKLHNKPVQNPKLKAAQTAQKKMQAIINSQQQSIAELQKEIDSNQQIGESIYSNYQKVEDLLLNIKKVVSSSKGTEQAKQLKELRVIKHDAAKKTVVVELDL